MIAGSRIVFPVVNASPEQLSASTWPLLHVAAAYRANWNNPRTATLSADLEATFASHWRRAFPTNAFRVITSRVVRTPHEALIARRVLSDRQRAFLAGGAIQFRCIRLVGTRLKLVSIYLVSIMKKLPQKAGGLCHVRDQIHTMLGTCERNVEEASLFCIRMGFSRWRHVCVRVPRERVILIRCTDRQSGLS